MHADETRFHFTADKATVANFHTGFRDQLALKTPNSTLCLAARITL